ncbi:MAG: hypothetical protein LAT78_06840 [Roseinatronobacter sp.]|nr:hypothetical protein [Roseinatronobacter sp.]
MAHALHQSDEGLMTAAQLAHSFATACAAAPRGTAPACRRSTDPTAEIAALCGIGNRVTPRASGVTRSAYVMRAL